MFGSFFLLPFPSSSLGREQTSPAPWWWWCRPGSWSLVLSGSTAMVEPAPLHCGLPMRTLRARHQRTVLPTRHIKVPTTPDVRTPGPHTGQPASTIIEARIGNAHGPVHFVSFSSAAHAAGGGSGVADGHGSLMIVQAGTPALPGRSWESYDRAGEDACAPRPVVG